MRALVSTKAAVTVFFALLATAARPASPFQDQRPAFRTKAVTIPITVRVVDHRGEPIRDLNAGDFEIYEDRVRQDITQFSKVTLDQAADAAQQATLSTRQFIILLGRGRLEGPSRPFEGLRRFLKEALRSGDTLQVVAFDRITQPTTDRDAIERFLAAYRRQHEEIETNLRHWFSGLTSSYGGGVPSTKITRLMQDVFDAPGIPPTEPLWPWTSMASSVRESVHALVYRAPVFNDHARLAGLIERLRSVEGDKHVVFLTEHSTMLGGAFELLAARAANARVTIWPLNVGGLRVTTTQYGGAPQIPVGQLFANSDSRRLAKGTGGRAAIYETADKALRVLDTNTRFFYLLGYTPTLYRDDGQLRTIEVRVKRKNADVLHRGSYYATAPDLDRRETEGRIRLDSAFDYREPLREITVRVVDATVDTSARRVAVTLRVPVSDITFQHATGRAVAKLDLAFDVRDRQNRKLGELRRSVDLNLLPANFEEIQVNGVTLSAELALSGEPHLLRIAVWDFLGDRLGSAVHPLK